MMLQELEAFYKKQYRRLYLVALGVTMNREEAEDAVHNAMEKLLRFRRRPKTLETYVIRTVRNSAIDLARRRHRQSTTTLDLLASSSASETFQVSPAVLSKALQQLGFNEREAVWLHLYVGMSFRQISELQKASINTVASRYRRGIMRLKKLWEIDHEVD